MNIIGVISSRCLYFFVRVLVQYKSIWNNGSSLCVLLFKAPTKIKFPKLWYFSKAKFGREFQISQLLLEMQTSFHDSLQNGPKPKVDTWSCFSPVKLELTFNKLQYKWFQLFPVQKNVL